MIGIMKTILKKSMSAVALAGLLATAGVAYAQSTTTTTSTTESAGTVSNIDPTAITIQSTSSMAPTSYSYSKTTTYVDQNGNPVSVETVKSGLPVTVYYTRDGDRMIASKVVVQRTSLPDAPSATSIETKKTTTTTTTPAQ
jgi:ABC-type glycerol-3-phosphate transport system substrate-binding protein